jgi:hypothetical protein
MFNKESLIWNNTLDLGYGLMKQGKEDMIKTDDKIDFLSKAGAYPLPFNTSFCKVCKSMYVIAGVITI